MKSKEIVANPMIVKMCSMLHFTLILECIGQLAQLAIPKDYDVQITESNDQNSTDVVQKFIDQWNREEELDQYRKIIIPCCLNETASWRKAATDARSELQQIQMMTCSMVG